jgi:hypothetical protein
MREQIKKALSDIIDIATIEVMTKPQQFRSILADILIETNRELVRNLLRIAVCELNAYTKLKAGFEQKDEFIVNNLATKIAESYMMDPDIAMMVIECVAELVGYKHKSAILQPKQASPSSDPTIKNDPKTNSNSYRVSYDEYIDGDSVYFLEDSMLHKKKLDGTNSQRLTRTKCNTIYVYKNWIYFTNQNKNGISRIDTDGKNESLIKKDNADDIFVSNDWIFYNNDADDLFELWKMKIDGSDAQKIINVKTLFFWIEGDWIFYVKADENDEDTLFRIRTEGTNNQQITDDNITDFICYIDGWIFYKNDSEEGYLYKIKPDGSQRIFVCSETADRIILRNGFVYFYNSHLTCFRVHPTTNQVVEVDSDEYYGWN